MRDKQIDKLNELLTGEKMAIDIYNKTKNIQGDNQVQEMLNKFQKDHEGHAQDLEKRIKELGGKPETGTGISGIMAEGMAIINSIRGPEHLLEQVYEGEDKGVHAYEDRIDELDQKSKVLITDIMNKDHEHLQYFKSRMEKEKKEKGE